MSVTYPARRDPGQHLSFARRRPVTIVDDHWRINVVTTAPFPIDDRPLPLGGGEHHASADQHRYHRLSASRVGRNRRAGASLVTAANTDQTNVIEEQE